MYFGGNLCLNVTSCKGKGDAISLEVCPCVRTPITPTLKASWLSLPHPHRTILPLTNLPSRELDEESLQFLNTFIRKL